MAKKVNKRLEELIASPNLEYMRKLPAANCHELQGDNAGALAVDISPNHRIIFSPYHDPVPRKEDGGLYWTMVTCIEITEIGVDYH